MASVPQFYDDFTFPVDTSSQFLYPLNNGLDQSYVNSSSSFPHHVVSTNLNPTSFHVPYGPFHADVSLAPVTLCPEFNNNNNNMASCVTSFINNNHNNINNISNTTTQYFYNNGEECNCFSPELKPFLSPFTGDQFWHGTEGGIQVVATAAEETTNTKIGRYSAEERKDRILRYLKKKNQRNFNKTIKYACRKNLADRRVRIRGRFARNKETHSEEQSPSPSPSPSKNHNNTEKEEDIHSGDDYLFKMEQEDSWLQEAISDLIYSPSESYVQENTSWSF